jgi:hypothetical protein
MLLLPEGQTGEAWEHAKKKCSFGNWGDLDRKLLSVIMYRTVLDKKTAGLFFITIFNRSKTELQQ